MIKFHRWRIKLLNCEVGVPRARTHRIAGGSRAEVPSTQQAGAVGENISNRNNFMHIGRIYVIFAAFENPDLDLQFELVTLLSYV